MSTWLRRGAAVLVAATLIVGVFWLVGDAKVGPVVVWQFLAGVLGVAALLTVFIGGQWWFYSRLSNSRKRR